MITTRFSSVRVMANVLAIILTISLVAAYANRALASEPVVEVEQTETHSEQMTNSSLAIVVIVASLVIGAGSLALAAYTSQQAAQGIPLPAFVELSKTILEAGAKFVLPIGAELANKTANKLDDLAITEIARASGWTVTTDPETGKVVLTAPKKDKTHD